VTARELLGRWLAAKEQRHFREFPPEPGAMTGRWASNWTIKLVERGTDVAIVDAVEWDDAAMRALRKVGGAQGD
jgi:hypothetical protein